MNRQKHHPDFTPGTLVAQYIDDTHYVFGIVTNPSTDYVQKKIGQDLSNDPENHCVLVFAAKGYNMPHHGIFFKDVFGCSDTSNMETLTFPCYKIAQKATAVRAPMESAIALYNDLQNAESPSGLSCGTPFVNLMEFPPKKRFMIECAILVDIYLKKTGNYNEAKLWMYDNFQDAILAELSLAVPI